MTQLDRSIRQIRPRIQHVSPVSGYGVLAFSVFNALFGLALFALNGGFPVGISILGPLFGYDLWGILFFLSGFILFYGYRSNSWDLMRKGLLAMVFSKSVWEIALFLRWLSNPENSAILLLLWSLITALQFILYFYFPKGVHDV